MLLFISWQVRELCGRLVAAQGWVKEIERGS